MAYVMPTVCRRCRRFFTKCLLSLKTQWTAVNGLTLVHTLPPKLNHNTIHNLHLLTVTMTLILTIAKYWLPEFWVVSLQACCH